MIEIAAWFEACQQCGKHGVIHYPDGTDSRICFTKSQARELVATMTGLLIDEVEKIVLLEQINSSDLVEKDEVIEALGDRLVELQAKTASGCNPL